MKFDHTNWKIFAIKVEETSFFEHWPAISVKISDDFDRHL